MCAMQDEPNGLESVGRRRERVLGAVYLYVILFVTWFFILALLVYLGARFPAPGGLPIVAALALVTEGVIYRLR